MTTPSSFKESLNKIQNKLGYIFKKYISPWLINLKYYL